MYLHRHSEKNSTVELELSDEGLHTGRIEFKSIYL